MNTPFKSLAVVLALALATSGPVSAAGKARPAPTAKKKHDGAVKPHRRKKQLGHVLPQKGAVQAPNIAPRGRTASERQLQDDLDGVLDQRIFAGGATSGVYVVDVQSGRALYSAGADAQLNPASNMKLLSTATALEALGPDFHYATRLYGAAPDETGTVAGDVTFVGMGDPTLTAADLDALAAEVAAHGVNHIEGRIVAADDPERDALGRPRLTITVRAGNESGALTKVSVAPDSAFVVVENSATVSRFARNRKDCRQVKVRKAGKLRRHKVCSAPRPAELDIVTKLEDGPNGPDLLIKVSGRLRPGQAASLARYAPSAAAFTVHTFRARLKQHGVSVDGGVVLLPIEEAEAQPEQIVLGEHASVPLSRLAQMINKPSNNFLADRLIRMVGAQLYGGAATFDKGVKAMIAYLGKIGAGGGFALVNGSGLSYASHLSVKQIAQILLTSWNDERYGESFFDSLSIAGKDGTLRRRFGGLPSRGFVYGKTGTLNGVAALSGFVTLDGERAICFSIVTNGYHAGTLAAVRASQARLVDAMYRHLRRVDAAETQKAPPVEITPPDADPEAPAVDGDSDGDSDSDSAKDGDEGDDEGDDASNSDDDQDPDDQPVETRDLPPAPPGVE
jgi:D-alanyl-D-alanine carboxypeptidase/D-alanyl-D-alanine-endopeptidase (penicillin-binding protein 4)